MIILISPSKTLSKREAPEVEMSIPAFIDDSARLVDTVRTLGNKLGKTLGVNDKLTELNRERFEAWSVPAHSHGKPAMYAFASDVYNGLAAFDMSADEVAYARDHLRMLSGLYGLLRPTDAILPYRLEMSTRLSGEWGKNLYDFWGEKIANEVMKSKPRYILNCASNEYSKAVIKHLPEGLRVITPTFLHDSGSGPRSKMTFAKYTRGLMARWAIENRVEDPDKIKDFDAEGYSYDNARSSPDEPVFIAPEEFTLKGRFIKF